MNSKPTGLISHITLEEVSETLTKTLERLAAALRARNAAEEAGDALDEILVTLYRMRELIVRASSGELGQNELDKIALALDALSRKIDAMSAKTRFDAKEFASGAGENLECNLAGVSAAFLGVSAGDIGGIVRGGGRKAIYNQPLGVDPVPGKYDLEKLNSLGITFTAATPAPHQDVPEQPSTSRPRQKH